MNLKRILSILLSVCLVAIMLAVPTVTGALNEDVDMDMDEDTATYQTYAITDLSGKYKTQGRASVINNLLMVDYSASGIEFSAVCEGDVSVTFNASKLITETDGGCYFTVIVDGVKQARDFCRITTTGDTTVTIATGLAYGKHTFEIYRQTEIERATIGIKSITLNGTMQNAPQNRDMYIEFVGDSITTAYGNLALKSSNPTNPSYPIHQDVTQGYAYLTARALDADWSLVARQGIGASVGFQSISMNTVYPLLRHHKDASTEYDFAREPDYVVIALGTNDINTYNNPTYAKPVKTLDEVKQGFADMLALVRSKNPNSKIIWAYNMMTNKANDLITDVIDEAGGELSGYYSVKLTQNTDGGNGHPYYTAHATMANELSEFINGVEASLQYGLGDADESNSVNLKDLVRLAQYVAEWDVDCNKVSSDINGDKKIDLNDVTHLAQYLAGWDVKLGALLD